MLKIIEQSGNLDEPIFVCIVPRPMLRIVYSMPEVDLLMPEENWLNDYVFTVDEFLTAQECDHYIQICEDLGFEEALVSTAAGQKRMKDLRNNERVFLQNEELAALLWERASDFVPTEYDGRSAVGVNELFRFYRYDPGQQFNWHQDFPFERDTGEKSYLTFMIYLSDGFEGGETSFEDSYSDEPFEEFAVVAKKGMALFFEHAIHHKGEPVHQGRKYVLRTDVMYASDKLDDDQLNGDGFGADEDELDEW